MRKRLKQKGYMFVMAIMALVVLFALAIVSLRLASHAQYQAVRARNSARALTLAEAAADLAEANLRAYGIPPTEGIELPEVNFGGGILRPTALPITPDIDDQTRLKVYTITAQGEINGTERTVIVQLRQQSFALYSYFTDYEESSITGDDIWFYARDRIYGPVHTNDEFNIDWSKTSADPIFHGTISSHSTEVNWGRSGEPVSQNDWRRVFDGGEPALKLGADRIPLPSSSTMQKNAAWGAESGFPTTNGVYLNTSGTEPIGGIYVVGDCEVRFDVESSTGNQIVEIKQGTKYTSYNVNQVTQRTTKKTKTGSGAWSSPTTYSGVPNGVVYSTGNITSLKGMIADNDVSGETIEHRNAWTVATDVNNNKDITITDNLTYRTPPNAKLSPDHINNLRAPVLGVVAHNIVLASSCPNEMTIDGVLLAGGENTANGSFYNSTWDSDKKNNLHILGGVIQKYRGPVGTYDQLRGVQTNGYVKDYQYDPRLGSTPPPFFPTTGQYDIVSWQTL